MRKAHLLLIGMLVGMSAIAESMDSIPHGTERKDSFPQAEISNGLVRAVFYLPDATTGYYRGSRFDWSGVMPVLEYKRHAYSGLWYTKYAPTINDAIMGPVEAFDPIGYDQTAPGAGFAVIGIGVMTRPATPYTPFRYYPLINAGAWQVECKSDRISFSHTLKDSICSYLYKKTVRLVKGKAQLVIAHRLTNTGRQVIETKVYDHNLFPIDQQQTGPGLTLSFPFRLTGAEERGIGNLAYIRDTGIGFLRNLQKQESAYAELHGYGDQSKDYTIRLENHHTGAGMRITCDRPLSRLVFWACSTTACPEPYIAIKIAPGATVSWTLTYDFYECSTDQK
jgi:hypothetical protein